jgi:putative ABC transport system permease protein
MAERIFPNENPIGKRLLVQRIAPGSRVLGPEVAWEIVGVVANERVDSLNTPYSDGMYATLEQFMMFPMGLVIRTAGAAGPTTLALKTAVHEVDPDLPLAQVRTVDQIRRASVAPDRLRTWLVGVFSALALILAAVGVYGVIAYSVAQQTHEIGVRAALGATRRSLVAQVMRRAATLTAAGLSLGLFAALGVGGVLRSLLFGISPWDAISLAGAASTLGVVALFAAWAPARRAASIDPIEALRVE